MIDIGQKMIMASDKRAKCYNVRNLFPSDSHKYHFIKLNWIILVLYSTLDQTLAMSQQRFWLDCRCPGYPLSLLGMHITLHTLTVLKLVLLYKFNIKVNMFSFGCCSCWC